MKDSQWSLSMKPTIPRPLSPSLLTCSKHHRPKDYPPSSCSTKHSCIHAGAVNNDQRRFGILQDFFQGLTQAVSKVKRSAIVASLITSDIIADDPTGVRVLNMLEGVFRRLEETFEPVSREDISELLRRRLFESVDPEKNAVLLWTALSQRDRDSRCAEHTQIRMPMKASSNPIRFTQTSLKSSIKSDAAG